MLLTIEKVAILKSADIFTTTPDHVLASVAAIAEEVELTDGETFIHEGTLETDMYVIIDGDVRIHQADRKLMTRSKGQVVGELEVLSPAPRANSATAIGDTHLFRVHKEAFDEVMADRPEIAQGIIHVLVDRLRSSIG